MLDLEYSQPTLGPKINFIQYGELKAKMKISNSYYQLNRDPTLIYPNNRPINLFVNKFINKDKKGCRNIYKSVHLSETESIRESIEKWGYNMNVTINYDEMAEAFVCNHKYNQNIYSRNIQYSVLHHRIFTRDKLLNMKIIGNDSCQKCQLSDSTVFVGD